MSINIGPAASDELRPKITVIGVGGAGGNAIANMIAETQASQAKEQEAAAEEVAPSIDDSADVEAADALAAKEKGEEDEEGEEEDPDPAPDEDPDPEGGSDGDDDGEEEEEEDDLKKAIDLKEELARLGDVASVEQAADDIPDDLADLIKAMPDEDDDPTAAPSASDDEDEDEYDDETEFYIFVIEIGNGLRTIDVNIINKTAVLRSDVFNRTGYAFKITAVKHCFSNAYWLILPNSGPYFCIFKPETTEQAWLKDLMAIGSLRQRMTLVISHKLQNYSTHSRNKYAKAILNYQTH